MTEIKYLLDRAVPVVPGTVVDPGADLARGRARLQRTRRNRLAVLSGAGVLAIALPVAVTLAVTSDPATPARPPTATAGALPRAVELVAYTGRQVPGYRVAEVPDGWEIQGGNQFVLTIAPKGAADRSVDDFAGKLVVMLASRDEEIPGPGTPLTVAGRPGVIDTQGDTQILRFVGADGRGVVVQAPTVLGWDAEHLAEFGAGVQVLGNADQGRG